MDSIITDPDRSDENEKMKKVGKLFVVAKIPADPSKLICSSFDLAVFVIIDDSEWQYKVTAAKRKYSRFFRYLPDILQP
jgi:hypothetical protein